MLDAEKTRTNAPFRQIETSPASPVRTAPALGSGSSSAVVIGADHATQPSRDDMPLQGCLARRGLGSKSPSPLWSPMSDPISPPPLTDPQPGRLRAHLGNGQIGLRVGRVPFADGLA